VIVTGGIIIRVAFMSYDTPSRFFDNAERDRQHALRRIQRRRRLSIVNWLMVPGLIAGAFVILAVWLW
jgi:hypothetical protein